MKFEGIREDGILIEMDEKELSIIIKGLEEVANLKMLSDMDVILFDYYKELEITESR